jgi:hypothetical protein
VHTLILRNVRLRRIQAMCPHHKTHCFLFDADLIEVLHQSAEELCAAVQLSFPRSSDLETAAAIIVRTMVDSAVAGERDANTLKARALATLQENYPSVAICGVHAPSLSVH